MKRILASLLLLCLAVAAHAGETAIDARWFKANYTKAEYMIPMRDGVRLYTAVYTPKNKRADHPVLYTRTPYGCAPYGRKNSSFWKQPIYAPYLEAEYILVFQDVRGRWMSEGEFENVRPFIRDKHGRQTDEASDAYDTVEWLLRKLRRHNGRVGVYGNSYSGFYALMAAASGHPAIRAVSPQAPVCDWFLGDDFHHNGALALLDAVSFLPNFGLADRSKPSDEPQKFESPVEGDAWGFFLRNTPADISRKLGGRIPFWDQMAAHPDYDDWWRARSALNATHGIKPAVLMVGGLFDAEDLYGTWRIYRSIRQNSPDTDCRLAMGPWAHGAWRNSPEAQRLGYADFGEEASSRFFRDEIEFPFFDRILRGEGDGGDDNRSDGATAESGALVFFTGENCWRELDAWSPETHGQPLDLYLTEEGTLRTDAPDMHDSHSFYTSDPHDPVPYYPDTDGGRRKEYMTAGQEFVDSRDDVLTFLSPVLEHDTSAAGPVEVTLYAAISSSDVDFVVKVIDSGPDGEYEMLVRGDIMRGRYRNGFSSPEPFEPNKPERISFVMPDIAHTFLAGHRIKVQIQSTWFPLFDRNPQRFVDPYTCGADDLAPCDVKIYHDSARPSHITLSTMK